MGESLMELLLLLLKLNWNKIAAYVRNRLHIKVGGMNDGEKYSLNSFTFWYF